MADVRALAGLARNSLEAAVRRLARSLMQAPNPRDLLDLGVACAAIALMVGPFGLWTGLLIWRPRPLETFAGLAVQALIAPALLEEAVFRGLMIPSRIEAPRATRAVLISTALYTLWHVVEAATFLPRARSLFLRPDFLLAAAVLGLACAILRRRSRSLWPAVLLHWGAVLAWQGGLSGPTPGALR